MYSKHKRNFIKCSFIVFKSSAQISIIIQGCINKTQWIVFVLIKKINPHLTLTQTNTPAVPHFWLLESQSSFYLYVPKLSILGKCILIISLVRTIASGKTPSGVLSCFTQKCITSTSETRNSAVTFVLSNMRSSQSLPNIKSKLCTFEHQIVTNSKFWHNLAHFTSTKLW
jgi:hypothetical protein